MILTFVPGIICTDKLAVSSLTPKRLRLIEMFEAFYTVPTTIYITKNDFLLNITAERLMSNKTQYTFMNENEDLHLIVKKKIQAQ